MAEIFNATFLTGLFVACLRMTVPILYATLGEVYAERSGLVNLGLEGTMLMGAFFGFVGTYFLGNAWLGLLVAIIAGMLFSLIFAFTTVILAVNQVLSGIALNFVAIGLTSFLFRAIFGVTIVPPKVGGFKVVSIPFLSRIPILGEIFFQHQVIVYMAFLLVPVTFVIVYKTQFGLNIRASGENPQALDATGVNVFWVRYQSVLLCGALAATGGAFMSLGSMNMFTEQMISGRGFIALAAVMVGNWKPKGVLFACLLFGFVDALQLRLQAMGYDIPYQFALMLPYVITLIAMVGIVGRLDNPEAIAKPFIKGAK